MGCCLSLGEGLLLDVRHRISHLLDEPLLVLAAFYACWWVPCNVFFEYRVDMDANEKASYLDQPDIQRIRCAVPAERHQIRREQGVAHRADARSRDEGQAASLLRGLTGVRTSGLQFAVSHSRERPGKHGRATGDAERCRKWSLRYPKKQYILCFYI